MGELKIEKNGREWMVERYVGRGFSRKLCEAFFNVIPRTQKQQSIITRERVENKKGLVEILKILEIEE